MAAGVDLLNAHRARVTSEGPVTAGGRAWARTVAARVQTVLGSIPGRGDGRLSHDADLRFLEGDLPEWLLLPRWLHAAWRTESNAGLNEEEFEALLWGQYALFLFVRIQDDLLDGQRRDLRLLYVADRFLLESLGAFQRFPALDEPFWDHYRRCLQQTVDGILEVGELECEAGRFAMEDLRLHARVSAIFQVGTAAVCHLYGRPTEMAWIARLQDQLAIMSQIGDDLEDLPSDVRCGRFTWVANVLLGAEPGRPILPEEVPQRLSSGLLQPTTSERVIAALRHSVAELAAAVPASAPDPIHELVRQVEAKPAELEQHLHETRVRWVFGEALSRMARPQD